MVLVCSLPGTSMELELVKETGVVPFDRLTEPDRLLVWRIYKLALAAQQQGQQLSNGGDARAFSAWALAAMNPQLIEDLQAWGTRTVETEPELHWYFHKVKANKLTLFIGRICLLSHKQDSLEYAQKCTEAATGLANTIRELTPGIEGR